MQFNTIVESIRPVRSTPEDAVVWEVGVRDVTMEASHLDIHVCDAVLICIG